MTVDGKPMPLGIISFTPLESQQASTVSTGVENGAFRADRVPYGKHKVAIVTLLPSDRPREKPLAPGETLPSRYNTETTLTAQINAEGPAELKFDLKSK